MLVKVLQVGVDATDREINEALYGNAPPGGEHLVIGHESFGQVIEVGDKVNEVKPGDYVSCTVRRPGGSIFDLIGRNDITSDEVYYERGINLCHGYLTEYFVDDAEYIVKVPQNLKHLGVLAEPASVCAKAIEQAFLAQQRLQVWDPKRAFVLGSGQIGLLATMMLRLRGIEVHTVATRPGPHRKSSIVEAYGAHYVSTKETSLASLAQEGRQARPDLRGDRKRRSLLPRDGSTRSQRSADLDEHHRGQTRRLDRRRQDQHRVGARQQAPGLERQRQPSPLRAGHASAFARRADLSGRDRPDPHAPGQGLDSYKEMMHLLEEKEALKVFVNVAE